MVEVTQEDREAADRIAALNAEVARLKHDLEVTGAQYQRLAALGNQAMTAPEWAVEAFDAATDAATGASVKYKPSACEAAALELSRRCVPVEDYQRVVEALRGMVHIQDVLDEDGACDNTVIVPRVAAARAALKETGNAD